MKNNRKNRIISAIGLISLMILLLLTIFVWRKVQQFISSNEDRDLTETATYTRHYVLIPENTEAVLWNNIYERAKAAAQEEGAYLELLGNWEAGNYEPLDYIKLAIAAKVDGIILKPDGSKTMRNAIDEAEAAGIPVVTVLNDDSRSSRESYVGANSYQLGTIYGKEILKNIDNETHTIMVLQRNDISGKELIFKELKAVVQQGLQDTQKVEIIDQTLFSGNAFDVEEAIRDILHDEQLCPDILICMNDTDSESAYHTMIDYNLVDKVSIIGFYQTETQLEAISKNTMPAVVTIDTKQVGEACIRALEEYHEMGYTSYYYSVEPDVITKENISHYLEELNQDEQ